MESPLTEATASRAAKLKDTLDGILIRSLTVEQNTVYVLAYDIGMHIHGGHPFPEELPGRLVDAEALVRARLAAEGLPVPAYLDDED